VKTVVSEPRDKLDLSSKPVSSGVIQVRCFMISSTPALGSRCDRGLASYSRAADLTAG